MSNRQFLNNFALVGWTKALTHRILRDALLHVPLHGQDELHQQIQKEYDQCRIEEKLEISMGTYL